MSFPFLLLFPAGLTTFLQVLPLAAARYNDFAKDDTPFPVVILADGFYLSSGFLNVLLYWYTRPYLLPYHMDSVDYQSIVLGSEEANNHLTSSGFTGSVMETRQANPVYKTSGITHQNGTNYRTDASMASPVRDITDEPTEGGATNIDDDI